jgi:dTDP-4-dehydrorhamnose reductase
LNKGVDSVRILVLGGAGMLGHKMFQVLRQRFPETYCSILGSRDDELHKKITLFQQGNVVEHFDALNFQVVQDVLGKLKPDHVINCIGIIKQRPEAKDYILSITLNSLFPHRLAELCRSWGGRLIHISTDCVFSGKHGNYGEDDPSDAEDLYGKTKFLGEVQGDQALTLRTSIIGRELQHYQSLLEWFLSQDHGKVHGFKRAFFSGVTTNHLAEVVANLMENHPNLTGLYQVASSAISKYDLLCLLREAYRLDIEILPDEGLAIDRSLKVDRFRNAIGYRCPAWPELVRQLANDPTPYEDWR